ncbi:hypothetical protein B0H11DRAFT_2296728 [Mycena galericulata]|nr:hypothetical protein B0H11DRAFT_2296728 [Mycena galericulata]
MRIQRATGLAVLLSAQTSVALTFGAIGRRIAIGDSTEVTWTSDSTDPPAWVLAVTNRTGNIVTTLGTVLGSGDKFDFVFPALESDSRPIFALQAIAGNQVLATSNPFLVTTFNAVEQSSTSTDPSPTPLAAPLSSSRPLSNSASGVPLPSSSPSQPIMAAAPPSTSSPSAPLSSGTADSVALPPDPRIYALVAGPIIAVVVVGVVGFILFTVCGCRGPRGGKSVEP